MKEVASKTILKALKNLGVDFDEEKVDSNLEIPKDYSNGDFAFPCFALASKMKMPPRDIAVQIREEIGNGPADFSSIETEGAYINFFLDRKVLAYNVINEVKNLGEKYGKNKIGNGERTMLEFSQPNTHKAFHVGHIRGTSIGESLSRIMEFSGDKVVRANYSGDTGMHIAKWIWCYKKFHSRERLKNDEKWIASIYVDAVKKLSKNKKYQEEVNKINQKLETREDKEINALWDKTRALSIKSWKKIYKELNTHFDVHFFESKVEKMGKEISQELVKKRIAQISDGATVIKFEDKNLGVWVLLRNDGTVLYSAKDLALAQIKFEKYKIEKSIYIIGREQEHHMAQLFKTLELMKFKNADKCKYVGFSEVRLPSGKMSSRTGENILYSEFMEEIINFTKKGIKKRDSKLSKDKLEKRALLISVAAIKYSMLKQGSNKNIIFDKKEALNFEGNTGPYLLYSYARANSIIKKAKIKKIPSFAVPKSMEEKETQIVLKIREFPKTVYSSYKDLNPAIIANYSYDLAKSFNEFYHACPVLEGKNKEFRINLVYAFKETLKNSLTLLGIETLEKM